MKFELTTETFELVKLALGFILTFMTLFVLPALKHWIKQNTTKAQREEALFWIKMVTRIAEDIYETKGMGQLKKEYVLEWLNKHNIKLSDEQLSMLIDMVVDAYNKNGWDKVLEG